MQSRCSKVKLNHLNTILLRYHDTRSTLLSRSNLDHHIHFSALPPPFPALHASREAILGNNNLVNLESLVILGDQVTSSASLSQRRSKLRVCSSEHDSSVDVRMLIHHTLEFILGFLCGAKADSLARFGAECGDDFSLYGDGLSGVARGFVVFVCGRGEERSVSALLTWRVRKGVGRGNHTMNFDALVRLHRECVALELHVILQSAGESTPFTADVRFASTLFALGIAGAQHDGLDELVLVGAHTGPEGETGGVAALGLAWEESGFCFDDVGVCCAEGEGIAEADVF